MSRLPAAYIPSFWRCTTPVDDVIESIGITFDTPTGTVRLTLPVDHARQLSESVGQYLRDYDGRLHSSRVANAAPSTATVVIYGPEGCGKSRHAAALAAHYGKSTVVDDWTPGQPLPANALALTTEPNQAGAIPFDVAMREAGLSANPPASIPRGC